LPKFRCVCPAVGDKFEEKLVEERRVFAMEEMQIAEIGSFCWNEACEYYQKAHHGNMIKNGKTDKGHPALSL
jgi:hypothetical protein